MSDVGCPNCGKELENFSSEGGWCPKCEKWVPANAVLENLDDERKQLEKDGIVQVARDEFQSFVTRVGQGGIRIPIDIRRFLNLKRGDIIIVAVRKAGEDEALAEYGYTSLRSNIGKRFKPAKKVKCPRCGAVGSLARTSAGYFLVRHGIKDGFKKPKVHYISTWEFPNFYERHSKTEG